MRYVAAVLLVLVPLCAYGEDLDVTGRDGNSEVSLLVDGAAASYRAVVDTGRGGVTLESTDAGLAVRDYGFIIEDRDGGFFAAVKKEGGTYMISVRMDVGGATLIKRYHAVTGPDPGSPPAPGSLAEEARRALDEDLARLEKANKALPGTDKRNIDITYEEYKRQYHDRDDSKIPAAGVAEAEERDIVLHVSVPMQARWGYELLYNVMVSDGSRNEYRSEFISFVGKGIEGAVIEGVIRDEEGTVLARQSGVTDRFGDWQGSGYVIPDNSVPHLPHTVKVVATHTISGQELEDMILAEFYAVAVPDHNKVPVTKLAVIPENANPITAVSGEPRPETVGFRPQGCFIADGIGDILETAGRSGMAILDPPCEASSDSGGLFKDMGNTITYENEMFWFDIGEYNIRDIIGTDGMPLFPDGVSSINLNTYKHLLWEKNDKAWPRVNNPGNAELGMGLPYFLNNTTITYNGTHITYDGDDINEIFPEDTGLVFDFEALPDIMIELDGSESRDLDNGRPLTFRWEVTNLVNNTVTVQDGPGGFSPADGKFPDAEYIVIFDPARDGDDKKTLDVAVGRVSSDACFKLTVRDPGGAASSKEACMELRPDYNLPG